MPCLVQLPAKFVSWRLCLLSLGNANTINTAEIGTAIREVRAVAISKKLILESDASGTRAHIAPWHQPNAITFRTR